MKEIIMTALVVSTVGYGLYALGVLFGIADGAGRTVNIPLLIGLIIVTTIATSTYKKP